MFVIRLIFALCVFFFLLFVFLQNSGEKVSLYFLQYTYEDIPLYWVIFYSFLAGSFFVILLAIIQEIRYRFMISRKNKEIGNLRKEVNDLRRMIAEEKTIEEESSEERDNENI